MAPRRIVRQPPRASLAVGGRRIAICCPDVPSGTNRENSGFIASPAQIFYCGPTGNFTPTLIFFGIKITLWFIKKFWMSGIKPIIKK